MIQPLSDTRRAELRASAARKQQAAVAATHAAVLADLTREQLNDLPGLQYEYTLTREEYRAVVE